MTAVLKPLTTAELLDRIFSLYRNRFFLFAGIMALPHALGVLRLAFVSLSLRSATAFNVFFAVYPLVDCFVEMSLLLGLGAAIFAASRVYLQQPLGILLAYRSALMRSGWLIAIFGIIIYVGGWRTGFAYFWATGATGPICLSLLRPFVSFLPLFAYSA